MYDRTNSQDHGFLGTIGALLLILVFYIVFAGDEGLDMIRSWYNGATM